MKGLRIIMTVTNDLTFDRRMFRICNTLAESGAEITLVGRMQKHSVDYTPGLFQTRRLKCFFHKGPLFYTEYNLRLFFYLLFTSFDIACACDLDTALPVRIVTAMKGAISVFDAHEYFTEVPELTGRPLVRRIWNAIAQWTVPGFDLRYTVGEELADIMSKKYNVPFEVIRNIPSTVQSPGADIHYAREKIILYQGALNVGRGLESLIEAMTKLPEWKLWLAGEGDITGKLKKFVESNNLHGRVVFLGWIFPHDLPGLMKKAYLGINLRDKGSLNDYYSLPNKFFDFIHAGLPSINMNYPEYARICARYPCAFLIDTTSSEEIVNAVNTLENDPATYQQMVQACGNASLEFSWLHEGNKLVRLYNEVIIENGIQTA
jgi:glycosyltransferase involved in cell wall biosynthesis